MEGIKEDKKENVKQTIENLLSDLLSAKNLIDASVEVKTSRRIQAAITRAFCLMSQVKKIEEQVKEPLDDVDRENTTEGSEPG